MDLVEFLNARLDEREQVARAAAKAMSDRDYPEGNPRWEPGTDKVMTDDGQIVVIGTFDYLDEAIAEHIARHDPAHMLADVAAKRQIIDGLVRTLEAGDAADWDASEQAGSILAVLAAQHAGHPDYRVEWKP